MSRTSRVPEDLEAANFANTFATAVAAAVEQILSAREQQPGNQQITFAISPAHFRLLHWIWSIDLFKSNQIPSNYF
jgi:hypothetical protein